MKIAPWKKKDSLHVKPGTTQKEKDEVSVVVLLRAKTTGKVTGSRDQPPRGLWGTPCKRRRNWPHTPDWGVGLGSQALLEVGLGLWTEKKAWAMGNPQVRRIWGVNGDSQQRSVRKPLRGAVSSSLPTPKASFKALSRPPPTEDELPIALDRQREEGNLQPPTWPKGARAVEFLQRREWLSWLNLEAPELHVPLIWKLDFSPTFFPKLRNKSFCWKAPAP